MHYPNEAHLHKADVNGIIDYVKDAAVVLPIAIGLIYLAASFLPK